MISIIVPIYNVEPYLRKCLDSVVGQTYRDLEILIIDDGSTDGSGRICDEYKEKDDRIIVFHTENRGLSAARNLGLDNATGEWIGFVDSDDWIEPDMYEVLLKKAEESGADVVECGCYRELLDKTVARKRVDVLLNGEEAVSALLQGKLFDYAWDKLWKKECFKSIRFPEERVHEDTAVTYRIFAEAESVCMISSALYHYRERKGSLSQTYDMANVVGFWLSAKEQYEFLWDRVDEISRMNLLRFCAMAVSRTWAYYCDCPKEDRQTYIGFIQEMNQFTRNRLPCFGYRAWNYRLRIGVFFPHFDNPVSFRIAWLINRMTKKHK